MYIGNKNNELEEPLEELVKIPKNFYRGFNLKIDKTLKEDEWHFEKE